jgi:hypothetical protein
VGGEFIALHPNANGYLAFLRKVRQQTVLVVLNYSRHRSISTNSPPHNLVVAPFSLSSHLPDGAQRET